jgi:hypothetical protein
MQRRTFLAAGTLLGGISLGGVGSSAPASSAEHHPTMRFYSPASQLASDGTPLTDELVVKVWAEKSAYNFDSSRGSSVRYEGESIPLVSVDGTVAGFGAMLVPNGGQIGAHVNFEYDNVRVVHVIWDSLLDGETVYWDEGHNQYWSLDKFGRFADYIENAGYSVEATEDLSKLDGADGLVITTPPEALSPTELDTLNEFVEEGGALFLHDQADFRGLDETDNLNGIAERLDLEFRFNSDQVNDAVLNTGGEFELLTANYSREFVTILEERS